jgi:hypothetical protein
MRIIFFLIIFFQFSVLNAQYKSTINELSILDNLKYVKNECKHLQNNRETEIFFKCSIDTHIYNYNFYKNIYDKKESVCANNNNHDCVFEYIDIAKAIYWNYLKLFKITENKYHIDQAIFFKEKALQLATHHKLIEEKVKLSAQLGYHYSAVPQIINYKKSFELLEYASSMDDHYAMNNLAYGFYEQGKLGKKNLKKALELYRKASLLGNHWANGNIAQFYMFGLASEEKSLEKTISHLKLARIEDKGTYDFSDLQILFDKKKLPKNEKEYYSWLLDNLYNKLKNKGLSDIHISEIVHIAHYSQTRLENFSLAYKWFYICQKYFKDKDVNYGSETEVQKCKWDMSELERDRLGNKDINKIKQEADDAWNKNIPIIN